MPEKELPRTVSRPVFNTYALTVCALLTALSVVLARVLTLIPAETTRISLEAVPIVLSGLAPFPGRWWASPPISSVACSPPSATIPFSACPPFCTACWPVRYGGM